MYVRFRRRNARLLVSLVASRRVEGRHQKEHIGFLGSVPIPAAAADRVWFWQQLHQRLSRLAHRIGDEQGKLMAAIHARIPMVTQDELQAVKILEAEADKSWWERIRDMNLETAEDHKQLAATVQQAIENFQAEAANADAKAAKAKERAERIKKGEE